MFHSKAGKKYESSVKKSLNWFDIEQNQNDQSASKNGDKIYKKTTFLPLKPDPENVHFWQIP